MRKMLLVVCLTGLTLWANTSDAYAQVRRGGNIVYGDGYGNYGYGGSYLPFGGAFLPFGGANLPDVYSGGLEYRPNYQGYGFAPNYYYGAPGYSAPMLRQSSYYVAPVAPQQFVRVTVQVPTADAQVWFDNQETKQLGMSRSFDSPPLAPNREFTYTVKARWMEDGKPIHQERQVPVRAGQNITVDFREIVAMPRARLSDMTDPK